MFAFLELAYQSADLSGPQNYGLTSEPEISPKNPPNIF
jgi:hypothetical protein